MTAEILRRAAALMRERAEAATEGPWEAVEGASEGWWVERPHLGDVAIDLHGGNARHIASWHPAVALAVADWLDFIADKGQVNIRPEWYLTGWDRAVVVARAYLGEAADD